jgi:hypothetical protein
MKQSMGRAPHIRATTKPHRSPVSGDILYWTARVEYWTWGAMWHVERAFGCLDAAKNYTREMRDRWTASGPEAVQ